MSAGGPGRLSAGAIQALDDALRPLDDWAAARWPGGAGLGQPIHTVYVPADQAAPGLCSDWGRRARAALDEFGATAQELASAVGLPAAEVQDAWPLLLRALEEQPIQDLRVDLEDGYGPHSDADEDAHADAAAQTLLAEAADPAGPRRCGIRHRSLEASTRPRAVRTLDRVVGRLMQAGGLPSGFVVTLPKVIHLDQVRVYVVLLDALEQAHGLPSGALRFEIQVETPQTILGPDGTLPLAPMIEAGAGRVTGLHYGTYDYSAAMGVGAQHQRADHPVAQTAKAVMRLAAAGTGVEVSDGSTNRLPVGDRGTVHANWAEHTRLVLGALSDGVRQGWDLHPAQLVTRHLTTIVVQRRGLPEKLDRLAAYLAATGQGNAAAAPSTSGGGALDEPATAQALAADAMRAVESGAAQTSEVESRTGAPSEALRALANRRVV
ncbi:MAG: hypothetical protein JHD16_08795 [Solirubrobacteraceae bacterium]|nr:hypothetical protein [Solirubrobacteraceae bacterium]